MPNELKFQQLKTYNFNKNEDIVKKLFYFVW